MRTIAVREDIKDLILDAADRLLARYGYKKMTIDDLAREVGIGKGTIYLHFSSKEDVALSRIDRVIERLLEQMKEIAASEKSDDEKIKQMLVLRVMYRFENVQHYSESLADVLSSLRSSVNQRREKYFESEAEIFARVILDGQESGEFRGKMNAVDTARAIIWATNALLPFNLTTEELGEPKEVEKRAAQIADILLQGLCQP